jgi:branched-chain amino acid transport system substrate-binding protein
VTSLAVAACSSSSSSSSSRSSSSSGGGSKIDHVTIGIIEDFSGAQSPLGTADAQGVQQAVDEINAAGGINSLGGAKISLNKYDTETNPDKGVAQATAAVADGVTLVIGGEISDTVIAGTNVTHRAGIPWIITGGTAPRITQRGFDDVFQAIANTDQSAKNYFDVMKFVSDKLGLGSNPTVGLSVSDTTYGNSLDAGFTKANSGGFFNVVTKVSYPLNTTDLSSIATRMVSKNPQVLFNEGYPTDGLTFGRLFKDKFQTNAKVFLGLGTYEAYVKELGATANGMLIPSGPSALFKGMPDKFTTENAKYKAAHGIDMPSSAVQGYIEAMLAYQALEKAGSTKGTTISAALHSIQLTHDQGNLLPQATVSFDSNGALTHSPAFYVQIQNGAPVGIYPANLASAEPVPFR